MTTANVRDPKFPEGLQRVSTIYNLYFVSTEFNEIHSNLPRRLPMLIRSLLHVPQIVVAVYAFAFIDNYLLFCHN